MSVKPNPVKSLQQLALQLISYWVERDCVWSQPYDQPMGAGTFHPHTFLRGIGPEPWRSVYVQPCRRPVDGRYGESPYRFQHYYQLQVLLKPAPSDIVDVFLQSLESVGIRLAEHDIGLLEDDWKGPTLGAWGLGWEVRANGQEITQFTYFQQLGGMDVDVVCGEITYGLERLFMYATGNKNGMDIPYNDKFTYGDVFKQNEFEFSHFNFKQADTAELLRLFGTCETEVARLVESNLVLPAYDFVLTASHAFNMLDARGALSAGERQRFIGRVRECARVCAELYRKERENLGFPMRDRLPSDGRLGIAGTQQQLHVTTRPALDFGAFAETADLVVEFGVEEMPPAFQKTIEQESERFLEYKKALLGQFPDAVFQKRMAGSSPEITFTQRRIILHWKDLPKASPASVREVWGPAERIAMAPDGVTLTPVGEGFCRKNGIDPSKVALREKQGTRFLYAQMQDSPVFLPGLVLRQFEDWIVSLPCPLKMRWLPADVSESFVRPVRWVLALFGDQVVPFAKMNEGGESGAAAKQGSDGIGRFGIATDRLTAGQRIQSPQPKKIPSAAAYFEFLASIGIERRFAVRRANLADQGQRAVAGIGRSGLAVLRDERLLDKCVGLAETPRAYVGRFSKEHLRLPAPLIASVLRDHMNAFAVTDEKGALAEYFVGLANYEPVDAVGMIEAAQQVVEGRLADGTFYFDSDLKTPLAELASKLGRQVFQEGLGSLSDKQVRIAAMVKQICLDSSLHEHAVVAEQAALRCKLDLQTGCVNEFPDEMQGVMGQYLIQSQGLPGLPAPQKGAPVSPELAAAAKGIGEHYLPLSMEGQLPVTPVGVLLAFADKWDTVASLFARGDRVKGNKDPFGIRRNTLAALRLAGAFGGPSMLAIKPQQMLDYALLSIRCHASKNQEALLDDLIEFVTARVSAAWREQLNPGAAEAVTRMIRRSLNAHRPSAGAALSPHAQSVFSFTQAYELAKALDGALGDDASQLGKALASYKRARNIVEKGKEWLAANAGEGKRRQPDPALFQQSEERELYQRTAQVSASALESMQQCAFDRYLADLATLERPMEKFFEAVMVNVPEAPVRANRLLLLGAVLDLYESFADFSAF